MLHYKDESNGLYSLDSAEYEYLLPAGYIAITSSEANVIRNTVTIQEAIVIKTSEMDAEYIIATDADVTYNGVIFQSGGATRENLNEALTNYVTAGNALPSPFTWRAKDNTDVTFIIDDIKGLAALVANQKLTALYNLQAKKDYITDPSRTIAEVSAVTW